MSATRNIVFLRSVCQAHIMRQTLDPLYPPVHIIRYHTPPLPKRSEQSDLRVEMNFSSRRTSERSRTLRDGFM